MTRRIVEVHHSMRDYISNIPLISFASVNKNCENPKRAKWYGGKQNSQAINYVLNGAPEYELRMARELADKIDATLHDRMENAWSPSVMGAYPIVPEALMGLPQNMRRRIEETSDRAPVKLIIEPSISQDVDKSTIQRRGAAISALVQRMGEERAVELWVALCDKDCATDTEVCHLIKLDTQPISLSQCIAVMASETFSRYIAFGAMFASSQPDRHPDHESIGWALGYPSQQRRETMRKVFGLAEADVIIQGGYSPDIELMDRDPVAWVNRELVKQREIAE